MTTSDEQFMARALELARSVPFTAPNPRVGAVVVRDGAVVGEGRHRGAGTPHAESMALAGIDAAGATLYVTLEPCNHHGRMPPCAPAIVAAGVARVVAAIADPDPKVDGRGFAYLRDHGVEVVTGVLEAEARRLNAGFLTHRTTGRPLVSLKLALSLDGRLAAPDGSARWITGEAARGRVHARRREVDAVVTGSGTVLADDPELTVRAVPSDRQPARVILDARGRVPADARLFSVSGDVIVVTTDASGHDEQLAWKEVGAEVLILPAGPAGESGVDFGALLDALGRRGWHELYFEAGATLAGALLQAGVVDRLELHYGAVVLGAGGPALADVGVETIGSAPRWRVVNVEQLDDDVIVELER
jgi:diaminohydroxyphosphoribosylaminopyrimidine deaminase / 5-amino-6-(5-phosphoribosylamino)uracil reductase